MRNAVALMILGALLIGSFFVFVAQVQMGYHEEEMIDPDGNVIGKVLGLTAPNPVLDAWLVAYGGLGWATFGCGVAQYVQSRRRRAGAAGASERGWTIAQIVLGALVVTSLVVFLLWAEPDWVGQRSTIYHGVEITIRHSPGWVTLQIAWKVASFLLGGAVTGLGVARFRRVRAGEAGQ